MLTRLAPILIVLLLAVSAIADMRPPIEIARQLGMSDEAIERVKKGEVVVEKLEPSSDKDLSIALVARLDAPLSKVDEFLRSERLVELSSVMLATGEIDTSTFSMAGMELPDEAVQALVDDPANAFHMSAVEAAKLTAAAAEGRAQVVSTYREILSARARAYWEKGVAGIERYSGKNRSPEADLRNANDADRKLIENPAVLAALESIPSKSSGKAMHSLSWAIEKGRDRAAPILNHRILYKEADGEVSIQRRFYSGYDYDALQIVAGILPSGEGRCVVFYLNHTYTSQVAGFGGSAKRSIGRKLMEPELVAEMERAQAAFRGD